MRVELGEPLTRHGLSPVLGAPVASAGSRGVRAIAAGVGTRPWIGRQDGTVDRGDRVLRGTDGRGPVTVMVPFARGVAVGWASGTTAVVEESPRAAVLREHSWQSGLTGAVLALATSSDGGCLVALDDRGHVAAQPGVSRSGLRHGERLSAAAIDGDRRRALVAPIGSSVALVDLTNGDCTRTDLREPVLCAAALPQDQG